MIRPALRTMVPEGFVLAMRAAFAFAPYAAPYRTGGPHREWLVVSRWGVEGEYLSIARAGEAACDASRAPDGLRPQATFLGLRLADPTAEISTFLLLRHLPPGVTVAGVFHPSDGIARLIGPAGALRLEAAGRYAHLRGEHQGEEVRADVPDPPEGAPEATAWSLAAARLPWIGEFIASGLAGPA